MSTGGDCLCFLMREKSFLVSWIDWTVWYSLVLGNCFCSLMLKKSKKSSFDASIFPTSRIKPVHITLADISLACQISDSPLTLNRFSCSHAVTQPHSHIATGLCHGDFPFCLDPHLWGDWHWSFEDWVFAGIVLWADRHFMDFLDEGDSRGSLEFYNQNGAFDLDVVPQCNRQMIICSFSVWGSWILGFTVLARSTQVRLGHTQHFFKLNILYPSAFVISKPPK